MSAGRVELLLRQAADAVLECWRRPGLQVWDKSDNADDVDLVTEADLLADRIITDGLGALFPGVPVVSEEREPPPGYRDSATFVLDPIDGTHNFAAGSPIWSISLALVDGGVVEEGWVLEVPAGLLYHARRGRGATRDGAPIAVSRLHPSHQLLSMNLSRDLAPLLLGSGRFVGTRMIGSHALGLAFVSDGRFGVHAGRGWPWDVAAGYALVREAGGRVCDLRGDERDVWSREHGLAGSPQAIDLCLELLSSPGLAADLG